MTCTFQDCECSQCRTEVRTISHVIGKGGSSAMGAPWPEPIYFFNNLILVTTSAVRPLMPKLHGRRFVGGQGDMSPLLFEVEGTPCVLSPLLSGVDIFCNAQNTAITTVYSSFDES